MLYSLITGQRIIYIYIYILIKCVQRPYEVVPIANLYSVHEESDAQWSYVTCWWSHSLYKVAELRFQGSLTTEATLICTCKVKETLLFNWQIVL